MAIKCSECGGGTMKVYPVMSAKHTHGRGMNNNVYFTNIHLNIKGREVSFGSISHSDDEVIVVCSNFPECNHHYVMKKSNLNNKLVKDKVGNIDIKGYGKHHYART